MVMDLSKPVVFTWKWGSEILKYSLLALIIPLFLVGWDTSGRRSFSWHDFKIDSCSDHTEDTYYSKMCKTADQLNGFGSAQDGATLAGVLSGDNVNDFDEACTLMNGKFTNSGKVEVTQTLSDLCIRFDSDSDPLEDIHICVGTEDSLTNGGYVTGYLYWTQVLSWTIVSLLTAYLVWEKAFNHKGFFASSQELMNHLAGMLHPSLCPDDKLIQGKLPKRHMFNMLSHGLLMAAVHTFSVILAVYASLAHVHYNDKDHGMNIDMVSKKVAATSGSDEEDYKQRADDCFSSVQAFFTFNVAQKYIKDDIDDAPSATLAVFILSIIIAAVSGLVLFSYIIVSAVVHSEMNSPGGISKDGFYAKLRAATNDADAKTRANYKSFSGEARSLFSSVVNAPGRVLSGLGDMMSTSEDISADVGASQDTGLFNLQRPRTDVPSSVAEEKNGGELFTKNVQVGASIMKLSF
tara:strand:+ start:4807 stop:6195 length:1389 start_codon:yes stop_codon:yes gene_type:complete